MDTRTIEDSSVWTEKKAWPDLSRRAEDPHAVTNISDLFSFAHGLTGVDQDSNYLWTYVLLGSFLIICVLTLFLRFANMANAHLRHMSATSSPGKGKQNFWKNSENWYWSKLKKHLFYAPLWKNRHNAEWKLSNAISFGTLPSRFHMLLLVLYLGSNIAYCVILPYNSEDVAITIASLRGRSGTLATLNLIPTVLFALRNNPLIWLLHVSYDTFNLLHRWAARIVILETVVHGAAWFANTYRAGKWEKVNDVLANTPSYQWGMVGTAAFVTIFFTAWSPVRHAFYETFLNTHRLFVMLGLAGVYVHVDLHHLPQVPWMWLIIMLWSGEWFLRLSKIFFYNISLRRTSVIEVEALPGEASRVTVHLVRPWHPKPGCHAHLYIPALALWSSHPFSIAWTHPDMPLSQKGPSDMQPLASTDIESLSKRNSTMTVSFICRACTGMTRKLWDKAAASPNQKWTTWGAIEGPYGGHEKLNSYGTIVLFAGGVGITHQVNFVQQIIKGYNEGTVACQKLLLVWSIPTAESLEWIKPWMDQILRMEGRKDLLRVEMYVTRPSPGFRPINTQSQSVTVRIGRADPQVIIDKEILAREGAMAVTVCGPGPFADSVRVAVRKRVDVGVVDFVEEAFSY